MKRYRGVVLFGGVEIFSYFYYEVINLELFFLWWTFISLVLIGYLFFGNSAPLIKGPVGSANRTDTYYGTRVAMAEKMGESVSEASRKQWLHKEKLKIKIPLIILIGYFLFNFIAMIIVTFN